MTYYVYKALGLGTDFRWELFSQYDDLTAAVEAAKALCPKGKEIYTEPSLELKQAFFGPAAGNRWSAMITTTPERA